MMTVWIYSCSRRWSSLEANLEAVFLNIAWSIDWRFVGVFSLENCWRHIEASLKQQFVTSLQLDPVAALNCRCDQSSMGAQQWTDLRLIFWRNLDLVTCGKRIVRVSSVWTELGFRGSDYVQLGLWPILILSSDLYSLKNSLLLSVF